MALLEFHPAKTMPFLSAPIPGIGGTISPNEDRVRLSAVRDLDVEVERKNRHGRFELFARLEDEEGMRQLAPQPAAIEAPRSIPHLKGGGGAAAQDKEGGGGGSGLQRLGGRGCNHGGG